MKLDRAVCRLPPYSICTLILLYIWLLKGTIVRVRVREWHSSLGLYLQLEMCATVSIGVHNCVNVHVLVFDCKMAASVCVCACGREVQVTPPHGASWKQVMLANITAWYWLLPHYVSQIHSGHWCPDVTCRLLPVALPWEHTTPAVKPCSIG